MQHLHTGIVVGVCVHDEKVMGKPRKQAIGHRERTRMREPMAEVMEFDGQPSEAHKCAVWGL